MHVFLLLGFVLGCLAEDASIPTEDFSNYLTETLHWKYDSDTLLYPPTDIKTEVELDRILLAWTPNTIATYTIISDGKFAWSLESRLNSFQLTTGAFPYEFVTLTLKSCNEKGLCGNAVSVTVRTAPGVPSAPQNFTVATRSKIVILNWEPPVTPKGPIDGYVLQYRSNQSSSSSEFQVAFNQTSYELSSLTTNTLYYFNLKAFNIFKGKQIFGKMVSDNVTTPPPAPPPPEILGLQRIDSYSVHLYWRSPVPYHSFIRWCSKDACDSSTVNTTNNVFYTINGLKAGEVYKLNASTYVVYRNDFILSSPASFQFQTTPIETSLNVTARAVAPTAALISWAFGSMSEDILVSISVSGKAILNVKSSLSSYVISNLTSWTSYSFDVSFCTSVGIRRCSSSEMVTIVTPPESFPASTILSIQSQSSTSVSFYIHAYYYKTYDGFHIRYCSLNLICKNMYTRTGDQEVTIQHLTANTHYDFTVRAYVAIGGKRYFSQPRRASVRTWKSVPETPFDINGTAISEEAVQISWNIYNSTVSYFEVSYEDQKVNTDGDIRQIVIYGLEPLKLYVFTVRGCGSNGCGHGTSVLIQTKAGIPGAPGNLRALRKSFEQIEVSWTAPPKFVANDIGYFLSWNCTKDSEEVQLPYTVNSYTIFTPSERCQVSLGAYSIQDDMLRLGEPAVTETIAAQQSASD